MASERVLLETVRMAAERLSIEGQLATKYPEVAALRAKMASIATDLFIALRDDRETDRWRPLSELPDRAMAVLLHYPTHECEPFDGADYSVQIGFWDGSIWREQGTNHDCHEPWRVDTGDVPERWQPLPLPPAPKESAQGAQSAGEASDG